MKKALCLQKHIAQIITEMSTYRYQYIIILMISNISEQFTDLAITVSKGHPTFNIGNTCFCFDTWSLIFKILLKNLNIVVHGMIILIVDFSSTIITYVDNKNFLSYFIEKEG